MTKPQGTTQRRAALYPRVSRSAGRGAEALERHTLAEQRELAESVVPATHELVVDDRWRDVDVSGKSFTNRPGYDALVQDIVDGNVHDVVVGYLSRLGRNARELLINVEQLHELGATIYFGKEKLIIEPGTRGPSRLLLTVLAAVAEMELDRLTDGLARANATAIGNGISIQVVYGYVRSSGAGSVLVFDDDVQTSFHVLTPYKVVRLIFQRRTEGVSCTDIAAELNDLGVPTPTGLAVLREERDRPAAKQWLQNTVASIVRTHTYRGVIPKGVAFRQSGRSRKATAWEYLPAKHAAIVDDVTFKAAQLKSEPAIRNGTSGDAVLQGLVRCQSCSRTMKPSRSSTALNYVCQNKACPKRSRITRAQVDAYVVQELIDDHVVREHEGDDDVRAKLAQAELDVDEHAEALERYVGRSGLLADDVFARGYPQHLERLETAQRRVRELQARLRVDVADKLKRWDELSLDEQRVVLRSQLDAVVVVPAPGQGRAGVLAERVHLIPTGTAPFELSGTGRVVDDRVWPLETD